MNLHSERAVFASRLGITSAQRALFRNLVSNSSFHSPSTRDSGWSHAWNKIGRRRRPLPDSSAPASPLDCCFLGVPLAGKKRGAAGRGAECLGSEESKLGRAWLTWRSASWASLCGALSPHSCSSPSCPLLRVAPNSRGGASSTPTLAGV